MRQVESGRRRRRCPQQSAARLLPTFALWSLPARPGLPVTAANGFIEEGETAAVVVLVRHTTGCSACLPALSWAPKPPPFVDSSSGHEECCASVYQSTLQSLQLDRLAASRRSAPPSKQAAGSADADGLTQEERDRQGERDTQTGAHANGDPPSHLRSLSVQKRASRKRAHGSTEREEAACRRRVSWTDADAQAAGALTG